MNRRVVVTGIGLVSSLGHRHQRDLGGAARRAERRHPHHPVRRHRVRGADRRRGEGIRPAAFIEKKDVKKMDVFIQYAIAASQFAMDDAGSRSPTATRPNIGVFIGSGIGGFITIEREHKALLDGGPRKVSPFFIPSAIINLAVGPGVDPIRREGAELGDLHRVLGLGARHRRRRTRSSSAATPTR